MDVVHGAVGVGLHKALGPLVCRHGGQVALVGRSRVVHVALNRGVPHLQERGRQALHGRTLQAHARVLPMAKGVRDVEVLVGDVVAAREAHAAVDDRDLAVVAVVEKQVEARGKGVEHLCLDALGLQALDEVGVDEADGAHVVVKDTHLNARAHALLQDALDGAPAFGVLDGVVLHEDAALRAKQLLLLCLDALGRVVVVGDGRVVVQGVERHVVQVAGDVGRAAVDQGQARLGRGVVGQKRHEALVDLLVALAHLERVRVQANEQVQRHTHDGQRHDEDDPGHL